jgi:uncharacterized protein (TIGR02001 family)
MNTVRRVFNAPTKSAGARPWGEGNTHMRRGHLIALALFANLVCASVATGSGFSGVGTVTSEYIYRGLAMSDGGPAVQLGLDYQHNSGFFAGAWASTIDLTSPSSQRDYELDFYLGYLFEPKPEFTASVTLLRYTYPRRTGAHNYDYNELLMRVAWRRHYALELAYTNDLFGRGETGHHWEFQTEWPIGSAWLISAALGGNDLSNVGATHYLHWDVGASARFSRLTVDLRWFDNQSPGGFIARASAGSQVVVSVSTAF